LCRYLGKYWLDGTPRRPGEMADFTVYGSLPGATAVARQRPDGVDVVVLLNNRRDDHIDPDLDALTAAVDAAVDGAK
jgi:hypothetical protein